MKYYINATLLEQTWAFCLCLAQNTVLDLLKEAMLAAIVQKTKGFLVDGFPRDTEQAEKFTKEVCASVNTVMNFNVCLLSTRRFLSYCLATMSTDLCTQTPARLLGVQMVESFPG